MSKTRKILLLAFLILAIGVSQTVSAQKPKRSSSSKITVRGTPVLTAQTAAASAPADVQRRLDAFEKVWRTIHQYYFDPTFNNLDWMKIYQEFEPKARTSKTDADLHRHLGEMIDRLQRSHLAIIPPEIYQAIEKARTDAKQREEDRKARIEARGTESEPDEMDSIDLDDPLTEYGPGIELRIIDDKFVITRLLKDSAGAYAGLKTGYVVDSINDVSMGMLLAKLQVYSAASKNIRRYLPEEIVEHFLNGEKDSQVKIGYRNEKDELREVSVRRERIRSETVAISANFPETQLRFETASLGDDIGVVRFNRFALRVVERFCDALTEFKDKKAIVLDLRGNLGGSINGVIGLASMLTDKRMDLGTSIYRTGPEPLTAESKVRNFKGRIVVLVDDLSASAAEMFTASLQDSRRAIVIGNRTAGETLPALMVDLPTGARLLYPIANYKSASGKLLEGNGVTPDQVISLDRTSLLEGRDVQIEAAVKTIGNDSAFAKLLPPPVEFRGPVNTGSANVNSVDGDRPPPPPPAMAKKTLPVLGTVTVKAPPLPAERAPVKDPRAVRIIDAFSAAVGTRENIAKVRKLTMIGEVELQTRGVKQSFDYKVYHELPNKYAEITSSLFTGEMKKVSDGTTMHLKTAFGLEHKFPSFPESLFDLDYLIPIERVKRMVATADLSYLGIFEREGVKLHTIEAKTRHDDTIALTYDVKTGMLAGIATRYSTLSYSDYRKVGDLTIPFQVENTRTMTFRLTSIEINTDIDASVFKQQELCFDKPIP